jgi:hypothetical protein
MTTKIPSHEDIRRMQAATHEPEVEAAVAKIVAGMQLSVSGQRMIVDVDVPSHIRNMVRQRFEAQRWSLKFFDDQRDGSSVEVIAMSTGHNLDER